MKLGIITDVHNNLTALKAVTEYFEQQKCEKVVCCGDIIGIGPYPEATVQYMMRIPNLVAVRGNHDRYLIEGMSKNMDYGEMLHHKWEHSMLSEASVDFLRSLTYRKDITIGMFKIAIMHYCMDSNNHYINYKTNPSEEDLKRMFFDVECDIILYGHDHLRSICKGDKLYINVGSLGCPAKERNIARAGILTIESDNVEIEPIELVYDAESVVNEINKLNYPEAENIKKFFYGM